MVVRTIYEFQTHPSEEVLRAIILFVQKLSSEYIGAKLSSKGDDSQLVRICINHVATNVRLYSFLYRL